MGKSMKDLLKFTLKFMAGVAGSLALFIATAAQAQDGSYSVPWQLGMQNPVGPLAVQGQDFWNLLLWICIVITIFVTALLIYVMIRFRASANPVPSKVTHNTLIEIIWTIVPVVILLIIFIPSMRLLYDADDTGDADLTIKAIGNQWYWEYEYPDQGFSFLSTMIEDEDLQPGQPRLLAVDERVIVPVGAKVRLQTTSVDVIHSWAIPAFFIKMDAVPGRLNEVWFMADEEGLYYGQCSELCGIRHGFMPIAVEVVSRTQFNQWVRQMQQDYGSLDVPDTVRLASAN